MRFHFAGDGDRGRSRCRDDIRMQSAPSARHKGAGRNDDIGREGGGGGGSACARARAEEVRGERGILNFSPPCSPLDPSPVARLCFANLRQDKYAGDNLFRNLFSPFPLPPSPSSLLGESLKGDCTPACIRSPRRGAGELLSNYPRTLFHPPRAAPRRACTRVRGPFAALKRGWRELHVHLCMRGCARVYLCVWKFRGGGN